MKTTTLIALFCCLLITATYTVAQDAAHNAPPESVQQCNPDRETRLLHHLLQMDDTELGNLRETIERIEKMSPEEKAQLSDRISKINRMPPEKLDAMRKRFKSIPKEQRQAMRDRWMEMSPEDRAEWREKLRNMPHAERKAIFKEQGFMPPHPNPDRKGTPEQHEPQPQSYPDPAPSIDNKEN